MAESDSVYFPSLELCLSNERLVLSWQSVYLAICNIISDETSETANVDITLAGIQIKIDYAPLLRFLTDSQTREILHNPFHAFQPFKDSKAKFEKLTSAINLTPHNGNDTYNLKELKDDALWLANDAKIDETSALRIIILEYQNRSKEKLVSKALNSDDESIFNSSSVNPDQNDKDNQNSQFSAENSRRNRIIRGFLNERLHLLRVSDILIRHYLDQIYLAKSKRSVLFDSSKVMCSNVCKSTFHTVEQDPCLQILVQALVNRMKSLDEGFNWTAFRDQNETIALLWQQHQVDEAIIILQLLISVAPRCVVSSESVTSYFTLLEERSFFQFDGNVHEIENLALLRILSDVATATLLRQPKESVPKPITSGKSSNSVSFHQDPDAVQQIYSILQSSIDTGVQTAAFSVWQFIIFIIEWVDGRPSNATQHEFLQPEKLKAMAVVSFERWHCFHWIPNIAEVLNHYYRGTVNIELDGLIRELVLYSLSTTLESEVVVYDPEILGAALAILDVAGSYLTMPVNSPITYNHTRRETLGNLLQPFLDQAQARFPYETQPFISIMRALFNITPVQERSALPLFDYISAFDHFTEIIEKDFEHYEQVDSDMIEFDRDLLALKTDLPLFLSKNSLRRSNSSPKAKGPVTALTPYIESDWHPAYSVTIGTQGEAQNTDKPLIVRWELKYKPLSYLVDCLATAVPGSNRIHYATKDATPLEVIEDIIRLFAAALEAAKNASLGEKSPLQDFGKELLRSKFADIEHEQDLITIVYEIFESMLEKQKTERESAVITDILTACLDFFHAMIYFAPSRIWPILVRSQLLDLEQGESVLEVIIANAEVLREDFSFLLRAVKLFDALIDLAYTQPQGKVPAIKKNLTRLAGSSGNIQFTVPSKTIRTVMRLFLVKIAAAYDSSQNWRFKDIRQRSQLHSMILSSFNKILEIVYAYDQEPDLEKKFSKSLADCARLIAEGLLSPEGTNPGLCNAVLRTAFIGIPNHSMGKERLIKDNSTETIAALKLLETALRIGCQGNIPITHLENRLFREAPSLAQLFAISDDLQVQTSKVMDALLTISSSRNEGQSTPSLPGHMGSVTAAYFLSIISSVGQTLTNTEKESAIWRFLTRVLDSQQQWFSVYLITGRKPRTSGLEIQASSKSILEHALDKLSEINEIHWHYLRVPLEILRFVTIAYSKWPISAKLIRSHPKFLPAIIEYFSKLRREDRPPLAVALEAAVAARITEIITMHLYNRREVGDFKFASSLINKLGYFKNFGFVLPVLNRNQQTFLKMNLAGIYPGFDLTQTAHTGLFEAEIGENAVYDYKTALRLIESARGRGDHRGFATEIQWANINLSEMTIQLRLLEKCTLLANELAEIVSKNSNLMLTEPLIDVIRACCVDTRNSDLPSETAAKFQRSQTQLIEVLLQRLIRIQNDAFVHSQLVNLFKDIWLAFNYSIQDSSTLFSSSNSLVNRTYLRILLLALQPLTVSKQLDKNSSNTKALTHTTPKYFTELITIASEIIPKAFKNLAEIAHDESNTSIALVSDFTLLSSLLQTILKIPNIETQHETLALNLANSNVARYAINLFSWADQLLINDQPVYAEPAFLFLLNLTFIPPLASSLASEGLLVQLASANVMSLFSRAGGVGPFDQPARLHAVWARGVLPLCLNLLDAVGPPLVTEILAFLTQYRSQAARLIKQFSNRRDDVGVRPGQSSITLDVANEAHSLALFAAIMDSLKGSAALAGIDGGATPLSVPWDVRSIKEEAEDWLNDRERLRSHIIPVGEMEQAQWTEKIKRKDDDSETKLEERIVDELKGVVRCLGHQSSNGSVS